MFTIKPPSRQSDVRYLLGEEKHDHLEFPETLKKHQHDAQLKDPKLLRQDNFLFIIHQLTLLMIVMNDF